MNVPNELDSKVTEICRGLFAAAPTGRAWQQIGVVVKYTPDGSVSGHDFRLDLIDGSNDDTFLPQSAQRAVIYSATREHWRLTQDLGLPRWYKMTVTVERTGKFSVDFEYEDDYKEGDIMQRG
jgi:hypothetical protein